LFRKPVDLILLQNKQGDANLLAETINQLIEIPVDIVSSDITYQEQSDLISTLAETGCANRVGD